MLGMIKAQGSRQKCFQCHSPRSGLLIRQTFGLFILRCMHGADDINQPASQRRDHRQPIFFGAQWGFDFKKAAIIGDIQFVEREVMNADPGGHI